jgi:hypothetical protein
MTYHRQTNFFKGLADGWFWISSVNAYSAGFVVGATGTIILIAFLSNVLTQLFSP